MHYEIARDWVPFSNETDGFIVDLTPPVLVTLGDGGVLHQDKTFQVGFYLN